MTNDLRPEFALYKEYVKAQKQAGMKASEYDVWFKNQASSEKEKVVEKRKRPTHREEAQALRLQGELITLKNSKYDRIASIIWGRETNHRTWEERQFAIDDLLNRLRKEMWEAIDESELVKKEV